MTTNDKGRLGKKEKIILLLMLQRDEPRGCANPVWFDLAREFKIDFGLLSKKSQHSKFRKERNLREILSRLTTKKLIKTAVPMQQNSSSLTSPKRYGYSWYSLTFAGRLVAERIQRQELALKDLEDIEQALDALRALGYSKVTAMQVYDVLWQNSHQRFASRAEFDLYWTPRRLGLLLQKCCCGRMRVGFSNRHRKYSLT
ncbi:MAG: hypothetical protein FWG55_00925 [Candidatus Bathyarchaeota archaeon]|nr:hypothetical protein [Candidatus Termiticorpusculum sp.]